MSVSFHFYSFKKEGLKNRIERILVECYFEFIQLLLIGLKMNNINDCVLISAEVARICLLEIQSRLKIKTLLVKKQKLVSKISSIYD